MKNAGNGLFDRSQNMGPKLYNFLETFWAVRDSPETGCAMCVGN